MLTKLAKANAASAADKGLRRLPADPPESAKPPEQRIIEQRIVTQRRLSDGPGDQGAAALLAGLIATPAHSDPKFLYDAQGCALFDAICQLDEYYPTRTEAGIFARHRDDIVSHLPRDAQWIDLGAGDGAKARDWLPAVAAQRYIGVDIADVWLRPAVARVDEAHPRIEAIGVVADLTQPLALHALLAETPLSPALFFYPGSSIGNFSPPRALELLQAIRSHCNGSGDGSGRLLIGVDLVKDRRILEAAYDDALGVTAAFNLNLLRVANHLLGADFELRGFEHLARFNPDEDRIEMHLRARRDQRVHFQNPAPARRDYQAGETILTECSYKYTPARFMALLAQAGFEHQQMWTDADAAFGVFLASP